MQAYKPHLHLEKLKKKSTYRLSVVFVLPEGKAAQAAVTENDGENVIISFPVGDGNNQVSQSQLEFSIELELAKTAFVDVRVAGASVFGGIDPDNVLGVARVYAEAADGEDDRDPTDNQEDSSSGSSTEEGN